MDLRPLFRGAPLQARSVPAVRSEEFDEANHKTEEMTSAIRPASGCLPGRRRTGDYSLLRRRLAVGEGGMRVEHADVRLGSYRAPSKIQSASLSGEPNGVRMRPVNHSPSASQRSMYQLNALFTHPGPRRI